MGNLGPIIKKAARKVMPRKVYRAAKHLRSAISPNHLSPADRAAAIARLAGPVTARQPGWVQVFLELEKLGLHLFPVHYYSPLPDTRDLQKHRLWWDRETDMSVLRYDRAAEAKINEVAVALRDELAALPRAENLQSEGLGPGYGYIEAMLLHTFVRHLKPRKAIEVGCGVSTYYCSGALAKNREEGHDGSMLCIEPYPKPALSKAKWLPEFLVRPVQEVEPDVFRQLQAGDILFIDSSHTVRIGSDVNYLFLDVIPKLNPGVYVHIHDIPFPRVTPRDFWVFEKLMFWQEPVLLKALLTDSDALEMIYCSSYLWHKQPEVLAETFPGFERERHFPSSVWLRKLR